jgi:hypothetical protein
MVVWCDEGLETSLAIGDDGFRSRSDAGILDLLSGRIFFRLRDLSFRDLTRLSDLDMGERAWGEDDGEGEDADEEVPVPVLEVEPAVFGFFLGLYL